MQGQKFIILPGEQIPVHASQIKITNNFSIDKEEKTVVSNNMGELFIKQTKGGLVVSSITTPQKYFPEEEDHIIGVIVNKNAEIYVLDIGGPSEAALGVLDFEGASKRNRPFLEAGNLIYAKVLHVNKSTRPRLTCISKMSNKDWASGESIYGELKEGMVLDFPMSFCKSLLKDEKNLLEELKKYVTYEIAIGHNGKIWVNSTSLKNIMLILNIIRKSQEQSVDEMREFLKQIGNLFTA